jgi:hypothetical protein
VSDLRKALIAFAHDKKFAGKGPLCVALVITRHARNQGLPLNADALVTERGGQVLGLGRGSVQSILKSHGIERVLASEGGRTSRGSLGNMRDYVGFLNSLAENGSVDLEIVESFWIEQVHQFFAAKPFKIRLDASRSLRAVVQDLISQAEDRQKQASGTNYVGGVLQHLVGAKLDCAMGKNSVAHNSFSTSDQQTGRAGDFLIGDVAIHVTTTPTEALIQRCRENIDSDFKPIIVTLGQGVTVAEALAANAQIGNRIDVFEAEQFIALNLYELGKFESRGRKTAITDLVTRYNDIVDEFETDPSLKIELKS